MISVLMLLLFSCLKGHGNKGFNSSTHHAVALAEEGSVAPAGKQVQEQTMSGSPRGTRPFKGRIKDPEALLCRHVQNKDSHQLKTIKGGPRPSTSLTSPTQLLQNDLCQRTTANVKTTIKGTCSLLSLSALDSHSFLQLAFLFARSNHVSTCQDSKLCLKQGQVLQECCSLITKWRSSRSSSP